MIKKIDVDDAYIGWKIGDFLKENYEYSTRRLRNVDLYLDGKKVKNTAKKLKKNSKILIKEIEKSTGIKPIPMDLDIIYEDKNYLFVNKPPYIIVHPTQKKVDKTLANGVVDYFNTTLGKILVPRFFNRLDMNTTGVIIITKNAHAQTYLQEKGEVKKFYLALVKGIIKDDEFIIEKSLGRVGDDLRRREISENSGGKYAKTKIKVLKRLEDKNLTLVEAELFTGRTHQIRAHLSLMGYPILGDELYGGADNRTDRQMLHSYITTFKDMEDGKIKKVIADIPTDMEQILGDYIVCKK